MFPPSSMMASISQVHLGLAGTAQNCTNGVSLQFAASQFHPINVEYGIVGDLVHGNSLTQITSYQVKDSKSNYFYRSPNLHTTYFCNLNSNTQYFYRLKINSTLVY